MLGLRWFLVYELVISLPLTSDHNKVRSILHRGPRCAQTRPLLPIGKTRCFCPSIAQSKNDAGDWMRRFTASVEWYLSPETGLSRFWKSIEDRKQIKSHHMSLSENVWCPFCPKRGGRRNSRFFCWIFEWFVQTQFLCKAVVYPKLPGTKLLP